MRLFYSIIFGTMAARAALAARAAIGTADAFFAAFFRLNDIGNSTPYDQNDYGNNDIVNKLHNTYLSDMNSLRSGIEGVFCLQLFVFLQNEDGQYRRNDSLDDPAYKGHPEGAEACTCEKSTKEVDKEAN